MGILDSARLSVGTLTATNTLPPAHCAAFHGRGGGEVVAVLGVGDLMLGWAVVALTLSGPRESEGERWIHGGHARSPEPGCPPGSQRLLPRTRKTSGTGCCRSSTFPSHPLATLAVSASDSGWS
eukprot:760947-Hanusia_phi.AAC.9